MDYTNLKINEKCIKCGSCLGCGYDFLSSANDGSVVVKDGTMLESSSNEFKTLVDICPVKAFEIFNLKPLTKQDFVTELEKLKNYVVRHPERDALKFDKSEYDISIPVASGERRYEYSSNNAANRAAEREFDNKMYSKIDVIVLKIITEYRTKYIKPFYSKSKEDNSFFAKCNQEVSNLLNRLASMLKNNDLANDLPTNFANIEIFPEKDIYWKMLSKGEIMSDEMISPIRNEFNSSSYSDLSSYNHWDIDSVERITGTNWRGYSKTEEKYCYKNIHKAFLELKQDLLNACHYTREKIENRAMDIIGALIDEYNKLLKDILDSKITYLDSKFNLIPDDDTKAELDKYENIIRRISYDSEEGFYVNNEKITDDAKEIYITESNGVQFFYDGTIITKRFIENGIIRNEVLFKNNNFNFENICGFNGNILFVDYSKNRNLYIYKTCDNSLNKVDSDIIKFRFKNDYFIYVTTRNFDDRYATNTIKCCKIDGDDRRTISTPPGGRVFFKEITDTQITFDTIQDATVRVVTWNNDNA